MNYFPMFMDIHDKKVIICGSGKHALEKIEKLKSFRPHFHVIAPGASDQLMQTLPDVSLTYEAKTLTLEDLDSYPVFVIAAEEEKENERIAALCQQRHIPVNAVDQQKDCDFIFPSLVTTDALCIGISTSGVSPTGAVCLKNRIQDMIPDEMDAILFWVRDIKNELKKQNLEPRKRNALLRKIMNRALDEKRILSQDELQILLGFEATDTTST